MLVCSSLNVPNTIICRIFDACMLYYFVVLLAFYSISQWAKIIITFTGFLQRDY